MNVVHVNAYAKLNLTLDVVGAENGYHMLDSLVVTVDVYDRIVLRRRKDKLVRVQIRGALIPPESDNAQRAGDAFVSRFQTSGADVTVYKNIPVGAGMGGSSADAAGVIAGMGRLYGIADAGALKSLADEMGSDTGYLLTGGLARITGRGDVVTPLPFPPEMYFTVALPPEGVSTAACFSAYDRMPARGNRTARAAEDLGRGDLAWAARLFGNDLYPAAKSLCPAVERSYLALRALSPLGAGMTGSGSASFALFETEELAAWAQSRYSGGGRAFVVKSVLPARENFFAGDE